MPSFCAVINCTDRYGHSENISFHRFPLKRKDLLEQWEAFIQRGRGPEWHASRWSSLCSRHFREEDFRSFAERKILKKTAVPTILVDSGKDIEKDVHKKHDVRQRDSFRGSDHKEKKSLVERQEEPMNVPKSNCRLCGVSAVPVATFGTSFELYGMLQKCFPTLNIQQDDQLPKVLCGSCLQSVENFARFVDTVLAAQTDLQRKYRSRAVEKPLKIKQEPMVRVKQEIAEAGYEEQLELPTVPNDEFDLSTGIAATDDMSGGCCEQQHDEAEDLNNVEQKYEFCDFPIINDCDIMEIINLDDPFINIPDDDGNTTINGEQPAKPQQGRLQYLPSADELLQVHLLLEEHNYAYVGTDDFKEERSYYKTEKNDGYEQGALAVAPDIAVVPDVAHVAHEEVYEFQQPITNIRPTELETPESSSVANCERRALRPIVTSISAIPTALSDPILNTTTTVPNPPSTKSNGIVVLNESIVKSANGFQLHACMVCQHKFFSIETLKQHYTQTHGTPMVNLPSATIPLERITEGACKLENDFSMARDSGVVEEVSHESNAKLPLQVQSSTTFYEPEETEQNLAPETLTVPVKPQRTTLRTKMRKRSVRKQAKSRIYNLNMMAHHYKQLKRLYQQLQRKCLDLQQNVERLQQMPTVISVPRRKPKRISKTTQHNNSKVMKASHTSAHTCTICFKCFPSTNSLRQHSITHSVERTHACGLCQRAFKRRNGLLQHLKGFHLQLKPFACPVCKHCYALKCDMLRCRHSLLRNGANLDPGEPDT